MSYRFFTVLQKAALTLMQQCYPLKSYKEILEFENINLQPV